MCAVYIFRKTYLFVIKACVTSKVNGPVIIVVGIKKEKEKNSQKGKKRRERKGFPEIYDVVL